MVILNPIPLKNLINSFIFCNKLKLTILNKAFLVSVQNFLHDSPLMLEIQTNACHKLSHFRKKFKKMQVTNFFINSRVLTNSDLKFQARVQKINSSQTFPFFARNSNKCPSQTFSFSQEI